MRCNVQGQGGKDLIDTMRGISFGGMRFHSRDGHFALEYTNQPALFIFTKDGVSIISLWDGVSVTELERGGINSDGCTGYQIKQYDEKYMSLFNESSRVYTKGTFFSLLLG